MNLHNDVAIVVPTLNAGPGWGRVVEAITSQGVPNERLLVIDSGSTDDTLDVVRSAEINVVSISRTEFDHGGTRQQGAEYFTGVKVVVFITQDALFVNSDSLHNICAAFDDPLVGMAYGRQVPYEEASDIAAHARYFNYPTVSHVRSNDDLAEFGIKAAFASNSFAAYRMNALAGVGGFPSHLILGEDTIVAARMLQSGWKVAYVAEASVYHSHDYSLMEEMRRYFDIGVMHARERWLLTRLGKPEGEGMRFVRSEIRYLIHHSPWLIPYSLARTVFKYMAYRLGRVESVLPVWLKRSMSMHKRFWG